MIPVEEIFADKDFDNMLYAVHKIPQGESVFPKFRGLDLMPSFVKFHDPDTLIQKNEAIKYVVYAYDRHSPIFIKYRIDDVKRKAIAAAYAGWQYDPETGLFEDAVDRVLKGFNRGVNLMVVDYVRQYNDPEYSVMVSGYDSLYQKLNSLATATNRSEITDFDDMNEHLKNEELKGKLFNQAKLMAEQIDMMATKILTDDNKYLKKDLYSIIDPLAKNRLNITPEYMAGIR